MLHYRTAVPRNISAVPSLADTLTVSGGFPCPLPEEEQGRVPAHLEQLADRARGYVAAASSVNTRKAYASDWKHYARLVPPFQSLSPSPQPQIVGLYITACASGTIERGAKTNDLALATRNTKHFEGFGVELFDPWAC
jgi:hypothetical protein